MILTIGSLFSGIGGLELGLEWAGLGPTIWQVEKEPSCLRVLERHWPESKRHEDVRSVGSTVLPWVGLICGGFPCQDLSSAGKRTGLAGDRSGLWAEFVRVVAEVRPRWVVVENVRSGARNWVDAVRGDLGKLGYASLPVPISASDLGAPHERARVFIIACRPADANGAVVRIEHRRISRACRPQANLPQSASPNAHNQGQLQPRRSEREVGRWTCDARRLWTAEPDVARVVHRLPGRVDRERALGNAVVPQCAQVIGTVIRLLMEGV